MAPTPICEDHDNHGLTVRLANVSHRLGALRGKPIKCIHFRHPAVSREFLHPNTTRLPETYHQIVSTLEDLLGRTRRHVDYDGRMCLNPRCTRVCTYRPGAGGRRADFCSERCRLNYNRAKARLLDDWRELERLRAGFRDPAARGQVAALQEECVWALKRYGLADHNAVAASAGDLPAPVRAQLSAMALDGRDTVEQLASLVLRLAVLLPNTADRESKEGPPGT